MLLPFLRLSRALLALGLTAAGSGWAQDLPASSPFLPPAGASAPVAAAAAGYDLVGMTIVGADTLVSVFRLSDQRSLWVPVGKTVGEVTAVSYDPAKDEAVIRVGEQVLTLVMRKGAVRHGTTVSPPQVTPLIPAGSNAGVTPAAVAVPMKPLTQQEEKEMEARMLVSDLLEIGQQQRKAYQEAQRQAAAAKSAAARSAPPAGSSSAPAPKK